MKKTLLNLALLALMTPVSSSYGLGLGKMTVKSALDQPFVAEIELVDVRNVAIKDVKVGVADPENFEQVGLVRAAVLSLLSFKIEKNEQGKEVIRVKSTERMSEPYMELVVDLTWPEGQLYKAYTILLDPPGYRLVSSTIQGGPAHYRQQSHHNEPGVIDKTVITTVNHNPVPLNDDKKKSSYGPTISNDSIWQIAQRYKASELILPQVVLAIVGANPEAFTQGNLNGLKVGVRLAIPATAQMAQVPADLATAEVMAHDKAWNDKQPIEHVLTPPYTSSSQAPANNNSSAEASSASSTVPSIPTPDSLPLIPSNLSNPLVPNVAPVSTSQTQNIEQNSTIKTEISLTAAAVESVREANALLMEQLRILQKQNDKLQKKLEQREQELKQLKTKIQVLVKERQALPSQATTNDTTSSMSLWPILLLLLAGSGAAGFAFWYLKGRKQNSVDEVSANQLIETDNTFIKPREEPVVVETKEPPPSELMRIDPATELSTTVQEMGLDEAEVQAETQAAVVEPSVAVEEVKQAEVLHEDAFAQELPIDEHAVALKEEAKDEAPLEFSINPEPVVNTLESDTPVAPEESSNDNYLEFESGLHHELNLAPPESPKAVDEEGASIEEGIDFVFPELDEEKTPTPPQEDKPIDVDESLRQFFVEEQAQTETQEEEESELQTELKKDRLKSKKALETLLALAKTYISMDDLESARHSLAEVLEHGSKKQKDEANSLLESIKDK